MIQTNLGGLAGVAIGSGVGYGVGHLLTTMGTAQTDSIAWGSVAGCMAASIFGLLYDRSVVPEFRASYRALMRHRFRFNSRGEDYDVRERMAMFGIPIAFATYVIPVLFLIFLGIAWNNHSDLARPATFFGVGLAGAILTMVIGNLTTDHRLLQREIAFNTTPAVEPKPSATQAAVVTAPATPEQLARLRSKGRLQALIAIVAGFALLAFNHYSAMNQHVYYPKAVFGGPMIIMVGIFGLFEPRIMSRHLPIGKTYPKSVLLLTLVALAIGAVGGYQIYSWYRG